MPTIEPATIADLDQLADLLGILFSQEAELTPDWDKQLRGLQAIVTSPAVGQIFVARDGGLVLGMVSLLRTISTAEGGPVCWLEDMVVRPDARAAGIGSRLLQHAIDYARANGFKRITLLTDGDNDGARRFYQRHGFQPSAMATLRLTL
jgi:GNAT superfamily N-acetyltransferase